MARGLVDASLVTACAMLLVGVAGCSAPVVVTTVPDPLPPFAPARDVTLIVPPLTSPLPGKAADARYADLPRRLVALVEGAGGRAVLERDVVASPPRDHYVVRVELLHLRNESDGETTTTEFEVGVFDATGAPLERVVSDSGIVLLIDTSGRPPVMRSRYEVSVRATWGDRAGNATEANAFEERYAAVVAGLLYERVIPDLVGALDRATPYVQSVEAVAAPTPALGTGVE